MTSVKTLLRPVDFPFRRILVCTDFSEGTKEAVDYALSIAQQNHSQVNLLHVVPDSELDLSASCRNSLTRVVARELGDLVSPNVKNRAQVTTTVEFGMPYRTIVRTMERTKPDLLVMNVAFPESVAERLVRTASCPVMRIPAMQVEFAAKTNSGGTAA